MSIDSKGISWDERNSFALRQLVHPGRQNTLYSGMDILPCRGHRPTGVYQGDGAPGAVDIVNNSWHSTT
jgi:hypothetical protein